jgi:hypothetical protein
MLVEVASLIRDYVSLDARIMVNHIIRIRFHLIVNHAHGVSSVLGLI